MMVNIDLMLSASSFCVSLFILWYVGKLFRRIEALERATSILMAETLDRLTNDNG